MSAASRNFGEARLSAADGVVAHKSRFGASDHPGRFAATPPHEEGIRRSTVFLYIPKYTSNNFSAQSLIRSGVLRNHRQHDM